MLCDHSSAVIDSAFLAGGWLKFWSEFLRGRSANWVWNCIYCISRRSNVTGLTNAGLAPKWDFFLKWDFLQWDNFCKWDFLEWDSFLKVGNSISGTEFDWSDISNETFISWYLIDGNRNFYTHTTQ